MEILEASVQCASKSTTCRYQSQDQTFEYKNNKSMKIVLPLPSFNGKRIMCGLSISPTRQAYPKTFRGMWTKGKIKNKKRNQPKTILMSTQLYNTTSTPSSRRHYQYKPYIARMVYTTDRTGGTIWLATGDTAKNAGLAQEPQRSNESEQGQASCGPQNSREVVGCSDSRGVLCRKEKDKLVRWTIVGKRWTGEEKHTVRQKRSTPVAVMSRTTIKLLKIQVRTRLVRKALYESSMLFSSFSSGSTYGASARFTVDSNWLSISAWGLSTSSMKLDLSSSFLVCASGNASLLSEPLVPQETSCQLQKA